MSREWRIDEAGVSVRLTLGIGSGGNRTPAEAQRAAWHIQRWFFAGGGALHRRALLAEISERLGNRVAPSTPSDELLRHVTDAVRGGRLQSQLEARRQHGGGGQRPPSTPPVPPPPPPGPIAVTADIVEQRVCVLAQRPGQGLAHVTISANLEPPGGSATWTGTDPAVARVVGSGSSCTISGLDPGAIDVKVEYSYGGRSASDTIRCVVYRAEIEHPTGDPVAAGSATNELVYSAATPGVLTIECRARITPDTAEARACAEPHLRWSIDAIGTSALGWNNPDPANASVGTGLVATATFTGLPERNSDFGAKTVTMNVDGARTTTTIEVFWPKNAQNHPAMPGVPNWFYYWSQIVRIPAGVHLFYTSAATGNFGETRAMLNWGYAATPNKQRIHIMDMAATRDGTIPGLHGPLTGIDLFANTVLHEARHVRQVREADAVVGVRAGTCWRFGWSWNAANHNHWAVGPDGQPGRATVDDDADGTVDNQIVTGPGEMGAAGSDDVLLQDAVVADWPTAFGAVPAGAGTAGAHIGGHPIEQVAFQAETSPEHRYARDDWGSPGKNHRTLNRHND